ncbi:MAG: ABC transporter permease, partial [Cytophagaceae bacterium]|nr:ABC transporter permease [Gemmatimonadaceae bacterium]
MTPAPGSFVRGGIVLDLKATMRGLKRRPAFTTAAVATIALAIAASTAMFSAVDAILLRALPYATPERLVALLPGTFVANRELEQMRSRLRTTDQVAVFSPGWLMPLVGLDQPRQVNAARVSGNLFPMIGTQPALGRTFDVQAEVPGNHRVAILGHALWRDAFHGDPAIVGRSIDLEGARYTVAAVMPPGFELFDHESDLWVPMAMHQDAFTWTGSTAFLYARLRAGRTLADLDAEMRTVVPSITAQFSLPSTWGGPVMAIGLQESLVGNVSRMLWLLFGAVVFVLAIATGNVANLLLVRASERRAELALRTSLGAPQGRIARLLLGESLMLGLTGGAIGLCLVALAVRALPSLLPSDLPRLPEVALNGRILAFAFLATLLPSLAFGLAPVLLTWKTGLSAMLREARSGGV